MRRDTARSLAHSRRPSDPQSSLRWSALREATGLGAVAGGVVLVLLLLSAAPAPVQAIAGLVFLADLVVWRVASVRLRHTVERLPRSLAPWQRDAPVAVLVEV